MQKTKGLPWWANGDKEVARDPYLKGYWARHDGKPFRSNASAEWKSGWNQCDKELESEAQQSKL